MRANITSAFTLPGAKILSVNLLILKLVFFGTLVFTSVCIVFYLEARKWEVSTRRGDRFATLVLVPSSRKLSTTLVHIKLVYLIY